MTAIDIPALTTADVLADLEVGRSRPLLVDDLAPTANMVRPALGGRAFRATLATVQTLGRVRPSLAHGALEALWFTPWTVGRERDIPEGAVRRTWRRSGWALAGWELGEGPTVLLVHGWGGNSTDLANIGAVLARAGRHVVGIDLPAHGRSPGRMTNLLEMASALGAVGRLVGPVDAIVAHSMGGAAAIQAIDDGLDVQRLVLLAPPDRLASAMDGFREQARLPEALGQALVELVERKFGRTVWEDLSVLKVAKGLDVDTLVVHDADDPQVPLAQGRLVAEALGAEHLVTEGLGHGRILVDAAVVRAVVAKVVG